MFCFVFWQHQGLNLKPQAYLGGTLPPELLQKDFNLKSKRFLIILLSII
jgi:hypothetical protein